MRGCLPEGQQVMTGGEGRKGGGGAGNKTEEGGVDLPRQRCSLRHVLACSYWLQLCSQFPACWEMQLLIAFCAAGAEVLLLELCSGTMHLNV